MLQVEIRGNFPLPIHPGTVLIGSGFGDILAWSSDVFKCFGQTKHIHDADLEDLLSQSILREIILVNLDYSSIRAMSVSARNIRESSSHVLHPCDIGMAFTWPSMNQPWKSLQHVYLKLIVSDLKTFPAIFTTLEFHANASYSFPSWRAC